MALLSVQLQVRNIRYPRQFWGTGRGKPRCRACGGRKAPARSDGSEQRPGQWTVK